MDDAGVSLVRRRPFLKAANRRHAASLAASILFHIAILALLALSLFEPPSTGTETDPAPPVFIQMEPRPLLPGEVARTSTSARREAVPPMDDIRAGRDDAPSVPGQTEASPSPPIPRTTAGTATGTAPSSDSVWQVTPETLRAAVARSMRLGPVGCRAMDGRLSPAEQRLCDDRFNEAAGRAGPLGPRTLDASEARREAQFARDGARALAQYEARRQRLSGGVGIIGPGDCPGSNLGVGCPGAHLDPALRQGATTTANPGLGSNDLTPMRRVPGNE